MSRRWLGLVSALLLAVVGALLVVSQSSGQSGEDDSVYYDEPATPEEQAADTRDLNAVADLDARAAEMFPDEYGGLAREDGNPDVVLLFFTQNAEENTKRLAEDFYRPEALKPVDATYSARELEAVRSEISADVASKEPQLGLPAGTIIAPSPRDNRVLVLTSEPDEKAEARLREKYGEIVEVRQGEGAAEFVDCDSRAECKPDLRAGLRTESPIDACTTSFVALKDGNRQILSAAHCGGRNDNDSTVRRHQNDRYGEVRGSQFGASADAERHSIEGPFTGKAWIYVDPSEKRRDVTDVQNYEQISQGDPICFSGINQGKQCGQVILKNATFDPPGGDRYVVGSMCTSYGDSGGPVYYGGRAIGVVSAAINGVCGSSGNQSVLFSHIEIVESRLDVRVVHD